MLNILVLGNGAREHVLVTKLAQSPTVGKIYVAPGNGGTATMDPSRVINWDITPDVANFARLQSMAVEHKINLVVPGPELPLVNGITSVFHSVGIPVFGPSVKAAQLEASKAFSKRFMSKHNIPTASYDVFTNPEEAISFLQAHTDKAFVIKADGIAAGKGVIIPSSIDESVQAIKDIMVTKQFGEEAGKQVVIEQFLEGDEISLLTIVDGYSHFNLPVAQDHKRIFDGDKGLNTGGMGAYAPAPVATPSLLKTIDSQIVKPTIDGMRRDGMPFVGVLFTGMILVKDSKTNQLVPEVLEYNVRFGDPETQAVLSLLDDQTDLAQVFLWLQVVILNHTPKVTKLPWIPINYLHIHKSSKQDLRTAVDTVYEAVKCVHFQNSYYRKDIAYRAFQNSESSKVAITYADSGVSVDNGNNLVQTIKEMVRSTRRPGADSDIGGFGGLFDLAQAGFRQNEDTLLVGATDGVGTKLIIAQETGIHNTVGIDLVAMNVNDLVVQGAEPLFFLDYFATGALDIQVASDFVSGVANGCIQSGCALVGGETSEMPGMYPPGHYDTNGTAVGAVLRQDILPKINEMAAGDVLLGLASSGVHSNGFSLVRKIIQHVALPWDAPCPWDESKTLGEGILEPTKIYVKQLLPSIRQRLLLGLAHITGGGLVENIPRAIPDHLQARVDMSTWEVPRVFKWFGQAGNVPHDDILRTFNMGVGMVLIVKRENVKAVCDSLTEEGEIIWELGSLQERPKDAPGCVIENGTKLY
ncbi:bifunctional aminoimidazole ribotide synthase/glycinamide ribotide synthase [Saccharomyces cerevisiae]|nr:bifunctional aminoimidazole ribotide synthase/glycinamide ribotide synthase [Saccharomyces cerevisiae]